MPETFEELIGRYLDDLYSAALCFAVDEHQAEELLQEAAVHGFHAFVERHEARTADFGHWMLGLLVATYLERERRRGRDPLRTLPPKRVPEMNGTSVASAPLPAEGTIEGQELERWLHGVWRELQPGDRLILWLTDIARLRHSQVAEMVGVDVEQVRRRHYRARQTLSRKAKRRLAGGETGRTGT